MRTKNNTKNEEIDKGRYTEVTNKSHIYVVCVAIRKNERRKLLASEMKL